VATSIHAQPSEKIVVDGSTGVMPLVSALAKAYQERYPAATVEMGKGLGTKARLQALAEGKIDIALASHGLVAAELTRQGMAVHEIAKVAVVFGVNASVPTANVTDRQICNVKVMPWSGDRAKELAVSAGAFGMTTATVVEQSQGKIRPLSLNGVIPSAENVERKIYTLTRDSFIVTKALPPPAVSRFVDSFAVQRGQPSS
jgi:phosphate transport system substrate-binding protein